MIQLRRHCFDRYLYMIDKQHANRLTKALQFYHTTYVKQNEIVVLRPYAQPIYL